MPKQSLRIVFRTDASVEIGTGHVMRCLTLAEAMRQQGDECRFICREHPGHLGDLIRQKGFMLDLLPALSLSEIAVLPDEPVHARWLGVPWEIDAAQTKALLTLQTVDWLVVDHYALDAQWEKVACPANTRLFAIDDLADRTHLADVLLDQNLGRNTADYLPLVPQTCCVLADTKYALLRPEFIEWRGISLARRYQQPGLKRLLINLGGVDKNNVTTQVLEALKRCNLPQDTEVTVVMGASAPWLNDVKARARELPWTVEVAINVNDMALRMAEADLAIGAAGSTSWERCCMGLPAIILVLAENQARAAISLHEAGAAIYIDQADAIAVSLSTQLSEINVSPALLNKMSVKAAAICDGTGTESVAKALIEKMRVR